MSKPKSDLAIAYAVKRKSSRPAVAEPIKATEDDMHLDDADELDWPELEEEETPEAKETPEARVARIMQNFRLSNLGNKNSDD